MEGKMKEFVILAYVSALLNELQLFVYLNIEAPIKYGIGFKVQDIMPRFTNYDMLFDLRLHTLRVRAAESIDNLFPLW